MIGDMTVLLSSFDQNLTLTKDKSGSFVKGTWVENTKETWLFRGVIVDATAEMYAYYEGGKIATDGKILYTVENLYGVKYSETVKKVLEIEKDDRVSYRNTEFVVVGKLDMTQDINVSAFVLEKVVIK